MCDSRGWCCVSRGIGTVIYNTSGSIEAGITNETLTATKIDRLIRTIAVEWNTSPSWGKAGRC